MIAQIEAARPVFLVVVNVVPSWAMRDDSEQLIFSWVERYVEEYYQCDGVADILSTDQTVYRWGEKAINYQPKSKVRVLVFKRKV